MSRKGVFCLLFASFVSLRGMAQDTSAVVLDTVIFSDLSFKKFTEQAKFENKPYIIMFSASWCAPCHRIKNEIFTHPKIAQIVNENYLAYWVDIESFDGLEVNNTFRVSLLPTLLFFDPKGNPIDKAIGYFDGYYLFKKFRAHIPPSQRNVEWDHNIEGE